MGRQKYVAPETTKPEVYHVVALVLVYMDGSDTTDLVGSGQTVKVPVCHNTGGLYWLRRLW